MKRINITTIGEIQKEAEAIGQKPYKQAEKNIAKAILKILPEKWNPQRMMPERLTQRDLELTPIRRRINKETDTMKTPKVFNPNITERGNPLNLIRIFCNKKSIHLYN